MLASIAVGPSTQQGTACSADRDSAAPDSRRRPLNAARCRMNGVNAALCSKSIIAKYRAARECREVSARSVRLLC